MYDYGCLMAMLDLDWWDAFNKKYIRDEMLYNPEGDRAYGRELEPHFTLLYGLHDTTDVNRLKQILPSITDVDCSLKGISAFEQPEYDVLKFDVDTKMGEEINGILRSEFDYTNDYPDYHPHMTIAYLKKGNLQNVMQNIKSGAGDILQLSKPYKLLPVKYKYTYPNDPTDKADFFV